MNADEQDSLGLHGLKEVNVSAVEGVEQVNDPLVVGPVQRSQN